MKRTVRWGKDAWAASMKVPPKRKGNIPTPTPAPDQLERASMKVPPKRKGNHDAIPAMGRYMRPQ